MKYITLKAGAMRRPTDEVRQKWVGKPHEANDSKAEPTFGEWEPVQLVGWPILPCDLFNAEFRRPL